MSYRFYSLVIVICLSIVQVDAQRVGIGESNFVPNASAILDIKSSGKGVILPRMSTSSRLAIPPTKAMLVYDTTIGGYFYNTGTGWLMLEGSSAPTLPTITGYWKGVIMNIMTIMHRSNGTGRLYIFPPNVPTLDTTSAEVAKFDGTWQLNGDLYTSLFGTTSTGAYKFSSIIRSPANQMSGMVEAITPSSMIGVAFYLLKQ